MHRLLWIVLSCNVLSGLSCGASETEPHPDVHFDDRRCLTKESLAQTHAFLDSDVVTQNQPRLREVLIEDGGLKTLLRFAVKVIEVTPISTIELLFDRIEAGFGETVPEENINEFREEAILYLQGDHPEFVGEKDALLNALFELFDQRGASCDPLKILSFAQKIMGTTIEQEGNEMLLLIAFREALNALLDNNGLTGAALEIRLEGRPAEPEDETIYLGRDAFIVFVSYLVDNASRERFDINDIEILTNDLILEVFPGNGALQMRLQRIFELMKAMGSGEDSMFADLQHMMRCYKDREAVPIIAGGIYDILSLLEPMPTEVEEAPTSDPEPPFLNDEEAQAYSEAIEILLLEKTLVRSFFSVLDALFEGEGIIHLIEVGREAQTVGVIDELVAIPERIGEECQVNLFEENT